jgi:hypothetical protein
MRCPRGLDRHIPHWKSRRVLSVWLSWLTRRHSPYNYFLLAVETAATSLAIKLVPSPVATAADIEHAIESFAAAPNGGLLLPPTPPPLCIAISSSRVRPDTNCPQSTRFIFLSRPAA